jgi:integrase
MFRRKMKITKKKKVTKSVSENLNGTFDKGVDYSQANEKFIYDINWLISQPYLNVHQLKRLAYLSIAITQLQNGSRISETINAVKLFIADYDSKVAIITIAKRKDGFRRKILRPELINKEILERINQEIKNYTIEELSKKIRMFLTRHYGWNTHSLRYALINYLAIEKKIPVNLVSKLVGHKNMNQLLTYTQNKHVDDLLVSINKNII